jgi:ABC-type phosphate transport system permease subunit
MNYLFLALQNASPMIVTLVEKPSPRTTLADVIIGSLGLTGVLVLLAAVLGLVMAVGLVKWNKQHPPDRNHMPPLTHS